MTNQPAAAEGGLAGVAAEDHVATLAISGAVSGGSSAAVPRGRELFSPQVCPPPPPPPRTATRAPSDADRLAWAAIEVIVLNRHRAAEKGTLIKLQDDSMRAQHMKWGTADRAHITWRWRLGMQVIRVSCMAKD